MKKMVSFFYALLFISGITARAQGLNNRYLIDETDIQNSFKMLGIDIYKFPVRSDVDSLYLNFIVEEYHDTTLSTRSDNLEDIKKAVPARYIAGTMSQLLVGRDTGLVRLITHNDPVGPFEIQFSYNSFSAICPVTRFDRNKYGTPQARGFTYIMPKINERIPVLVVYAAPKGQKIIHCPGELKPADIKKRYPYTCFVYVELLRL